MEDCIDWCDRAQCLIVSENVTSCVLDSGNMELGTMEECQSTCKYVPKEYICDETTYQGCRKIVPGEVGMYTTSDCDGTCSIIVYEDDKCQILTQNDHDPSYSSLNDCYSAHPTYSCGINSGSYRSDCIKLSDGSGQYSTKDDCTNNCEANIPACDASLFGWNNSKYISNCDGKKVGDSCTTSDGNGVCDTCVIPVPNTSNEAEQVVYCSIEDSTVVG